MPTSKYTRPCLDCPPTEQLLALDTVLYNGFGGYKVTRDGETFYQGGSDEKWEKYKKLAYIEKQAILLGGKWKIILYTPLRGATWERKGKKKWVLIETNRGFA